MVKVNIIDYCIRRFVLGGFSCADSEFSLPARAIYIPADGPLEEILVDTNQGTNLIMGPAYERNVVYKGEVAKDRFEHLLATLRKVRLDFQPDERDVPETLRTWAKALYDAQHPPQEVRASLLEECYVR